MAEFYHIFILNHETAEKKLTHYSNDNNSILCRVKPVKQLDKIR